MTTATKKQRPSADITRSNILQAAQKLFASHGFAGTSISMIAKKANINQSLIYHHFTNKHDLWCKVKKELITPDLSKESPPNTQLQSLALYDFIKTIITIRFNSYKHNPDMGCMLLWQRLEFNDDKPRLEDSSPMMITILDCITQFKNTGKIHPRYINYTASQLLFYIFTNASSLFTSLYGAWFNKDEMTEEFHKQYADFIITAVYQSLASTPTPP
ncbi:putative acrAB operon repressor [Piscirickettsia salmonis]|uniref:TetR/AcrR family transcriptional regulator n=1 Tax=Piscirickettsia salmonis TaxID=1238 RepID=UPI0012BA8003|nr:TetR/AcrR family transcriptional regulator [Piscirickettsia salmonis]QGP54097.1 putative acrAB operon repressor [Piscirickettsia salmonis]QGP60004.1 putative acrAB operon repressor [Piscirickettsia salmonis]QGP63674.1 putative acrAB operon repressor [Piscirickettsia salmonis]